MTSYDYFHLPYQVRDVPIFVPQRRGQHGRIVCEETPQGLEIHAGGFPTTTTMMTTTMMMMMMAKNIEEDTDDGDDDGFKMFQV